MNQIELHIPGFSIAGLTWGNPKNPPILAVHGWLDNANSFEPMAAYLQDKFYLIAIDLPGHGLSSHLPPGTHYHFVDGLFTIIQIIDALKLNKVHLLGHSLGACLSSLVAGIASDRLHSVSLIEGLGPLTRPPETSPSQLTHYLKNFITNTIKPAKGYKEFERAAEMRAVNGYVSLDIAKKLCKRGLEERNGLYYWRHDRRLLSHSPLQMTEAQVLPCLKQISVPSFLLWADHGFSLSEELMDHRIKAVHDLTIKQLPGGHHVHMEEPEAVSRLLTEFYRAL